VKRPDGFGAALRTPAAWVASAVAAALALGVLAFLRREPSAPPASAEVEVDAGIVNWCANELVPIAGGGCFAAPVEHAPTAPLLLYLHGRFDPKTNAEELERQRRVARLATAKGFAVLALRGVQGECTQPDLAEHWCWPSNPRNADHGPAFVGRFEPAMRAARERVGNGRTVLLGFSNGAYFATLIATRALGSFDAIAIAHGGPVAPTHARGAKPPVLLITADDDPSDGEMQELDSELSRDHWAHEFVGREGGHALPDWDISVALTFFTRTVKESLPLTPPLQAARARRPSPTGEEHPTPRDRV
jgi:predicted esterase